MAEFRADSEFLFDLLDKHRRVQHRASSTVAQLPKNAGCELVLHPSDAVILEIQPPKLSGSKLAKALPSLVEERLLSDVDSIHVVATPRAADGTAVAAVVDRALLRRTMGLFDKLKRRVLSVVPAPFALSYDADRWRVRIVDGAGSVRTAVASGTSFENRHDVPVELQLLVKQAVVPPDLIEVDGDCDVAVWSQTLGVDVKQVAAETRAPPVVLDLLQYQFAAGLADWSQWRLAAMLALVLAVVMVAGLNLHAWKLRSEEAVLRERMASIVEDVIPGVSVVLDPLAQVRQRVDRLRSGAGISSAEFLSIALDLASLVDADSVQRFEYRNKVLNVEFREGVIDAEEARREFIASASSVGLKVRFVGNRATVQRREGA
jgi:general secretion pathway protein L